MNALPAKSLALDRPSPSARWWAWWCRYRLPHLTGARLYVTDLDGLVWCLYKHEGRDRVRILAVLEVVPWGANLEARRSSMTAIRTLAARAGVLAVVLEVDHRRPAFRVRTMRGLHVLVGPVGEGRLRTVAGGVDGGGARLNSTAGLVCPATPEEENTGCKTTLPRRCAMSKATKVRIELHPDHAAAKEQYTALASKVRGLQQAVEMAQQELSEARARLAETEQGLVSGQATAADYVAARHAADGAEAKLRLLEADLQQVSSEYERVARLLRCEAVESMPWREHLGAEAWPYFAEIMREVFAKVEAACQEAERRVIEVQDAVRQAAQAGDISLAPRAVPDPYGLLGFVGLVRREIRTLRDIHRL